MFDHLTASSACFGDGRSPLATVDLPWWQDFSQRILDFERFLFKLSEPSCGFFVVFAASLFFFLFFIFSLSFFFSVVTSNNFIVSRNSLGVHVDWDFISSKTTRRVDIGFAFKALGHFVMGKSEHSIQAQRRCDPSRQGLPGAVEKSTWAWGMSPNLKLHIHRPTRKLAQSQCTNQGDSVLLINGHKCAKKFSDYRRKTCLKFFGNSSPKCGPNEHDWDTARHSRMLRWSQKTILVRRFDALLHHQLANCNGNKLDSYWYRRTRWTFGVKGVMSTVQRCFMLHVWKSVYQATWWKCQKVSAWKVVRVRVLFTH